MSYSSDSKWFYKSTSSKPEGPISYNELQLFAKAGIISQKTPVWSPELGNEVWIVAADLAEIEFSAPFVTTKEEGKKANKLEDEPFRKEIPAQTKEAPSPSIEDDIRAASEANKAKHQSAEKTETQYDSSSAQAQEQAEAESKAKAEAEAKAKAEEEAKAKAEAEAKAKAEEEARAKAEAEAKEKAEAEAKAKAEEEARAKAEAEAKAKAEAEAKAKAEEEARAKAEAEAKAKAEAEAKAKAEEEARAKAEAEAKAKAEEEAKAKAEAEAKAKAEEEARAKAEAEAKAKAQQQAQAKSSPEFFTPDTQAKSSEAPEKQAQAAAPTQGDTAPKNSEESQYSGIPGVNNVLPPIPPEALALAAEKEKEAALKAGEAKPAESSKDAAPTEDGGPEEEKFVYDRIPRKANPKSANPIFYSTGTYDTSLKGPVSFDELENMVEREEISIKTLIYNPDDDSDSWLSFVDYRALLYPEYAKIEKEKEEALQKAEMEKAIESEMPLQQTKIEKRQRAEQDPVWFYYKEENGKNVMKGPICLDGIKSMLELKEIGLETLVWNGEGCDDSWVSIVELMNNPDSVLNDKKSIFEEIQETEESRNFQIKFKDLKELLKDDPIWLCYLNQDNKAVGPMTFGDIKIMVMRGDIPRETLVRFSDHSDSWIPFQQLQLLIYRARS